MNKTTTQTCSFCGAQETHTLEEWMEAGWGCSIFIYRFACSDPECRKKLYKENWEPDMTIEQLHKYNTKHNIKFHGVNKEVE